MEVVNYIGLDLGRARTGVARISSIAKIPEPIGAILTSELFDKLDGLLNSVQAEAIVIGLPTGKNGEDSEQTKWVKQMVDEIKQHTNLPIFLQDETLSTVEATSRYGSEKSDIDSLAACVILEDFIGLSANERVRA